jgi:hypothetical protein
MPETDPVSLVLTIVACVLILGCAATWFGGVLAARLDVALTRYQRRLDIERHIDNMVSGAPEGGRGNRPF